MIRQRIVEQAPDGSFFSTNAVTLIYQDMDGQDRVFFMSPDSLYDTVHTGIRKIAQADPSGDDKLPREQKLLKDQLQKVIKAGVKGILMVWGDKLLTLFYGTKDHPRPPIKKNVDLVDWYMDRFTEIAITHMMRNDIVLDGQHIEVGSHVISVNAVSTRPITGFSPEVVDEGATERTAE